MARKNVTFDLVKHKEIVSDDEENLKDYIKPVSKYNELGERYQNYPYFLRRCLSYIIQAKKDNESNSGGTIRFNYMDFRNKILKVEVVYKCSCPFCLVPCGSLEGLRLHLTSTHDDFEYKFRQAEDHQGQEVDVSLKLKRVNHGGGEQWIPFMFRSNRLRPRQGNTSNIMKPLNVRFLRLDINQLPSDTEVEMTDVNDERISTQPPTDQTSDVLSPAQAPTDKTSDIRSPTQPPTDQTSDVLIPAQPPTDQTSDIRSPTQPPTDQTNDIRSLTQPPTDQTIDVLSPTQPELLAQPSEPQEVPPVSRRKKLIAKRANAKRLDRLKSRQFYHSRTMQPMTYEEVLADVDSEDEVDDDEADLNERLRLERIKDASPNVKRYMYLWNIFVRKQRVLADGHVSWACEAFTRLHKEEIQASKSFRLWWVSFSITLYNQSLICGKTIDNCSNILLSLDEAGPSTSNVAADANNEQSMDVDG